MGMTAFWVEYQVIYITQDYDHRVGFAGFPSAGNQRKAALAF
jgi:hypothetical protein